MPYRISIKDENDLETIVRELVGMGFDVPAALLQRLVMPKCILFWEHDCRITFSTNLKMSWLPPVTVNDLKRTRKTKSKYTRDEPICMIDQHTGQVIREYNNVMDAATDICVKPFNIYKCARGKLRTAFGYIWKYKKTISE